MLKVASSLREHSTYRIRPYGVHNRSKLDAHKDQKQDAERQPSSSWRHGGSLRPGYRWRTMTEQDVRCPSVECSDRRGRQPPRGAVGSSLVRTLVVLLGIAQCCFVANWIAGVTEEVLVSGTPRENCRQILYGLADNCVYIPSAWTTV